MLSTESNVKGLAVEATSLVDCSTMRTLWKLLWHFITQTTVSIGIICKPSMSLVGSYNFDSYILSCYCCLQRYFQFVLYVIDLHVLPPTLNYWIPEEKGAALQSSLPSVWHNVVKKHRTSQWIPFGVIILLLVQHHRTSIPSQWKQHQYRSHPGVIFERVNGVCNSPVNPVWTLSCCLHKCSQDPLPYHTYLSPFRSSPSPTSRVCTDLDNMYPACIPYLVSLKQCHPLLLQSKQSQ